MDKKLVILSGPACVGKGPLRKALRRQHPDLQYQELVLCTSRKPREGEVHGREFYFLPRALFAQLDPDRFIVGNVRSDVQAIDMEQVRELLDANDLILAEVYPTLGQELMAWASRQPDMDFTIRTVALVPLSHDEIKQRAQKEGKTRQKIAYEETKCKLVRRAQDPPEKIEERASLAYDEIKAMAGYTDTIVNHTGEDDAEAWSDPLDDEPQSVLDQFAVILRDC